MTATGAPAGSIWQSDRDAGAPGGLTTPAKTNASPAKATAKTVATLPDFVAPNQGLKETFETAHEFLVNVLFALAGLHIAAALKHQFLDRDGLLLRMLPGRAP